MKITVHGAGYVGLVTAACFAHVGNEVLCVDIDADRVDALRRGEAPIHEPGLSELLREGLRSGGLAFSSDPIAGVRSGDLQFIAVGTPAGHDGAADLRQVFEVTAFIGRHATDPKVVVVKSTVPVGTTDAVGERIRAHLESRGTVAHIAMISNPEFLQEGSAVDDFMRPDRIVVGAEAPQAIALMRALYAPFNRQYDRLIVMGVRDAEFTKYAANAMLAARISLMNEFANLAERLGVDMEAVRIGVGSDPRIGRHFIYPGAGYGGSCFPKDVQALISAARDAGFEPRILAATEAVNRDQKRVPFAKLKAELGTLRGRTVAVWGLAFKPGTDDMREAPSRTLLEALWADGARVRAYDPAAAAECLRLYGNREDLALCDSKMAALEGADALVIVTEWPTFRSPNFAAIKSRLRQPVIVDGRNLYDPARLAELGFNYQAIGRPHVPPL